MIKLVQAKKRDIFYEVYYKYLLGVLGLISVLILFLTIMGILSGQGLVVIGGYIVPSGLKSDLQYLSIMFILFSIMYILDRRLKKA